MQCSHVCLYLPISLPCWWCGYQDQSNSQTRRLSRWKVPRTCTPLSCQRNIGASSPGQYPGLASWPAEQLWVLFAFLEQSTYGPIYLSHSFLLFPPAELNGLKRVNIYCRFHERYDGETADSPSTLKKTFCKDLFYVVCLLLQISAWLEAKGKLVVFISGRLGSALFSMDARSCEWKNEHHLWVQTF